MVPGKSVMSQGILGRILAQKALEVSEAQGRVPLRDLCALVRDAPPPRDFAAALRGPAVRPRVIAEVKRASPSAGPIRPDADPPTVAAAYQAAGAAAISVLTDGPFFDGSLLHLAGVRARVEVPVLRKDFIVDEYQVWEARAYGADAVLLIVAALTDAVLAALRVAIEGLGMTALVEVHDEEEAGRAVAAGASTIGVNHRDLRTFRMDMDLFARVRPLFPEGTIGVAESGIKTGADIARLVAAGADAVLVGERLMRHPSPGDALRELLA
jgi:indole-3-glycerol phosphate synthase